jgi:hypothetical protein
MQQLPWRFISKIHHHHHLNPAARQFISLQRTFVFSARPQRFNPDWKSALCSPRWRITEQHHNLHLLTGLPRQGGRRVAAAADDLLELLPTQCSGCGVQLQREDPDSPGCVPLHYNHHTAIAPPVRPPTPYSTYSNALSLPMHGWHMESLTSLHSTPAQPHAVFIRCQSGCWSSCRQGK